MLRLPHHRNAEREELMRLFEAGRSVQMLAPRRIGKTWLMGEVAKDLRARGWRCFGIDVEGHRTEEEVLRTLCREIEKTQAIHTSLLAHFKQRFEQLKGGTESTSLTQAVTRVEPALFAEALVEGLHESDGDTLILIDEISLFVLDRAQKDAAAVRAFLYLLRRLRQRFPRVRWFFSGSVGLDAVARRLGLEGALVDLEIVGLEPFSANAARSYIAELKNERQLHTPFEFADSAFEHLFQELGWNSPYYLKLVADRIRPTSAPPIATRDHVEAAFTELLRPIYRTHFATWKEHVEKNYPDDASRLRALLDTLCGSAQGEMEPTLLAALVTSGSETTNRNLKDFLLALQSDGLIEKDGDRWRFASGLVRRFWAEYVAA